jgi:hypothetical protein
MKPGGRLLCIWWLFKDFCRGYVETLAEVRRNRPCAPWRAASSARESWAARGFWKHTLKQQAGRWVVKGVVGRRPTSEHPSFPAASVFGSCAGSCGCEFNPPFTLRRSSPPLNFRQRRGMVGLFKPMYAAMNPEFCLPAGDPSHPLVPPDVLSRGPFSESDIIFKHL